ncbi:MAG: hypothetical protein NEHIOOID_01074 [Holosporales bacterium]
MLSVDVKATFPLLLYTVLNAIFSNRLSEETTDKAIPAVKKLSTESADILCNPDELSVTLKLCKLLGFIVKTPSPDDVIGKLMSAYNIVLFWDESEYILIVL